MNKEFYTKINGTTFTKGQQILGDAVKNNIKPLLMLVPEPENKYDNKAIKVCLMTSEHVGYIPKDTAQNVFDDIVNGYKYTVTVNEITGGDGKNFGCNLKLEATKEE